MRRIDLAVIRRLLRQIYDHPALGPFRLGRRRPVREILRRTLTSILAALTLLGVLALFGRWSDLLDFLNVANPIYWLASLVLLALVIRRKGRSHRRLALIGMFALGLTCLIGQTVALVRPFAHAPRQSSPIVQVREVTVLSLNAEDMKVSPARAAAVIEASRADVVLLQEVGRSALRMSEHLRRSYPYRADCFTANVWCRLVILSRRPILATGFHQANWSNRSDVLSYLWADVATSAGPMRMFEVHLVYPALNGIQSAQIRQARRMLDTSPYPRVLLAGDFNSTQWSAALARSDRTLGLNRVTGAVATWPDQPWALNVRSPLAVLAPDQIYLGPGLEATSVRRLPSVGAHNYPVVADLVVVPIGPASKKFQPREVASQ